MRVVDQVQLFVFQNNINCLPVCFAKETPDRAEFVYSQSNDSVDDDDNFGQIVFKCKL